MPMPRAGPAFLNLHTAGGLGHGFGNLINAHVSGTPLVVTAGQQDSRHTITDPLLFGDLVGIATPRREMGAARSRNADQLPILLRRAFHDCSAAPTGPVFLSLPMDVMEAMSDGGLAGGVSTIDRCAVAGSLDRLAEHLAAVAPGRLAMIAGDEIDGSDASARPWRWPNFSVRRSTARPGRRTSPSRPPIRSGPATCRPRRPRSRSTSAPTTRSSRSAASR